MRGIDRPVVVLLPVPVVFDPDSVALLFNFRGMSACVVPVDEVDDDRGCLRKLSTDEGEIGTNRSAAEVVPSCVELCTMTVRHTLAPNVAKPSSGLESLSTRRDSLLVVIVVVVVVTSSAGSSSTRRRLLPAGAESDASFVLTSCSIFDLRLVDDDESDVSREVGWKHVRKAYIDLIVVSVGLGMNYCLLYFI